MKTKIRYSVFGLGKLGACSAACIASKGFNVIGVDVNKKTVNSINNRIAPVQEPFLDELIKKTKDNFKATVSCQEAILNSDVSLIIVPTPSDDSGKFSLKYVSAVVREIAKVLKEKKGYHLIDIVSTVLPGSIDFVIKPILEAESGKKCGKDFGLCYNPEFIALGSVIHDFLNPDFVLIGQSDNKAGKILEECYKSFCDNTPPIKRMNIINAELSKIALNTYVTTKIAYSNMLGEICEKLPDADVDVITDAIGLDARVGIKYLKSGLGYGGECFPRDNVALGSMAEFLGAKSLIVEATDLSNKRVLERLKELVMRNLKTNNNRVGIIGLSFKPGTPVVTESQGYFLARDLVKEGLEVLVYDPLIKHDSLLEFADSYKELIFNSNLIVITNPDPDFKNIRIADFYSDDKKTIIDCWRFFKKELSNNDLVDYNAFGLGKNSQELKNNLKEIWKK